MLKLKRSENNKKNNLWFVALVICCSFVFGFLGSFVANKFFINPGADSSIEETSVEVIGSKSLTTAQVVALVENSVVSIDTELVSNGEKMIGAGSGIVIREDGYIATNAHVVDGAQSIKVTMHNGTKYTAELVGKNEKEDIAVLKVSATNLTPVTFEDSNNIKVGDNVVVIGNALGTLGSSVTDGIISAVNRTLTVEDEEMTLIQTDAEINHGNSGGGMFGSTGKCLGIIVAKSTGEDVEGVGFAIPSNVVKSESDKLIAKA